MVSLRPEDEFFRRLLNLISLWIFILRHQSRIGLSRKFMGENTFHTDYVKTKWKMRKSWTSKTSKSYYTFALTQDLLHKSHVTRNLSLTTHLLNIFRARWYIFAVLFLDDFSFNISSYSDPFIFRLTWLRTSSWLTTHMYWDNGLSKTEERRLRKCMYRFYDAWLFLYRSIT